MATIVVDSWTDKTFKKKLLEDGRAAISERYDTITLGDTSVTGDDIVEMFVYELVFVENTATIHNLVACKLYQCYPVNILGDPPMWYKSIEYRFKTFSEPKAVLREFGVAGGDDLEVNVWDSGMDQRYIVLPYLPDEHRGRSRESLMDLVSRDLLIGTKRL